MRHGLNGMIAVAFAAGIMWLGWWKYQDFLTQGSRPPPGTQKLNEMEAEGVPDFSIEDIDGNRVELSDFKDKIVILSFWASWCEPCVQEFPSLVHLIKEMKGDVVLLAISADHSLEALQAFIKAFDAKDPNIKIMWDKSQRVAGLYGTEILPESYILGYQNKVIRKIAGVDKWDGPQAISFFKELVELRNPKIKEGTDTDTEEGEEVEESGEVGEK